MAQCKQSPQEFIRNVFTPQIAVLCTPLAEKCCQKNNLTFVELVQPFSKLYSDVHYKDPSGNPVTVRNLKLSFLDVNLRPPQTTLARKLLNSSVSEIVDFRPESLKTGEYALNVMLSTPWFEAWRDTFLRVQYPSDHEYTKHFLACVLVVSSAEVNVSESFIQLSQTLNQMYNNSPGKLPKWFSSNIQKYFVVVHDNVEGNIDVAMDSYESLKNAYGEVNCYLLRMNSRPPGHSINEHLPDPWSQFISNNIEFKDLKITPETSPHSSRAVFDSTQDVTSENTSNFNYHPLSPDTEELNMTDSGVDRDKSVTGISQKAQAHGLCLSTEDVEQVKALISEFCKNCLMPYIEKQMNILNDVISNKKGVSRSLFSATKRWFNPNKPGASSVAVNNLIYAPDSPELQVRRLGDLYFMFGHYSLAFQAYHLAKRDYNTDQAWLYYAGALEMAALAAFMGNEASRKTCDYMEESITTYLNTCKMPHFATRATLLSSECLKSRTLYGDAAHQLIRMTSEESDLRSALFLEQAAYCFLHSKMVRKYAFHMVLAGHRFSKAAQRKHSLRSYKQAHQIYEGSGWVLAEDHIYYTIGRQANNLSSYDEAVHSFAQLLKGESKQSAQQQGVFLKEYLTILDNKITKTGDVETPLLAIPMLEKGCLKLLMGPTPPLTTPGKVPAQGISFADADNNASNTRWVKLEELLVHEANQGGAPIIFKPLTNLYTVNDLGKSNPIAVVNEPIQVCITLINSLQIVLQLRDIYLLWSLEEEGAIISNDNTGPQVDNYMKTHVTKSALIQGTCCQNMILSVTPLKTGIVTLKGIRYTLTSSNTPTDNLFVKGKQLFHKSISSANVPVKIKVVPLAPCLQITFSEINLEFLCEEVQKVSIDFHNTGTLPLRNILMATSEPELLCNCESKQKKSVKVKDFSTLTPTVKDKLIRENHITHVPLKNNQLDPGESSTFTIYVRAPSKPGPCLLDLLFYYENIDSSIVPKYRLVRHKWSLSVQESMKVEATVQGSYMSKKAEEIDIVLRHTNLNKVHSSTLTEIILLNIGLLSRFWILREDVVRPKYINLHSQESAYVLLKARRVVEKSNKYSNVSLNNERNVNQNFNAAYLAFAKKSETCQINMFDSSQNNCNISKDMEDGVVLVQWQAYVNDTNKRSVDGQTEVFIQVHKNPGDQEELDEFAALSDPATLLEESINKDKNEDNRLMLELQSQVTYNLIYPPVVEHDFKKLKICVVPVTLLIHSIVQDNVLDVVVATINGGTSETLSTRTDLFCPYASKNFSWLGTGTSIKKLKPLSTESLCLSVVVSKSGTFDLGARIEIFCSRVGLKDEPVLQTCQIQSALIVVDKNS